MIGQPITLAFLFVLAACSFPPQAQEVQVQSPVIVVEGPPLHLKPSKEIKVPAIKPLPQLIVPPKSTADTRCPPTEGETEQQRIIRKLDCLLERD